MSVAIRVVLTALVTLTVCTGAVPTAVAVLIPFDYTWEADISWSILWTENDVPFSSEGTVHRTGIGQAVLNTEATGNAGGGPHTYNRWHAGGWHWDIDSARTDPGGPGAPNGFALFDGFRPPVPEEWGILSTDPFETFGPAFGDPGEPILFGVTADLLAQVVPEGTGINSAYITFSGEGVPIRVPEPATVLILAAGAAALLFRSRYHVD